MITADESCPKCKGVGWLQYNVPIGHPLFSKLIPCECIVPQLQAHKLRKALGESLIPPDQQDMTFESFNPATALTLSMPKAYEDDYYANRVRARVTRFRGLDVPLREHLAKVKRICQDYAQAPEGHLILLGEPGCGKTHLAAAVANYLIANGIPVVFAIVPDLLDTLRPSRDGVYHDILMAYQTAPLLILDDLGAEKSSEWTGEKLYQIINYRYNHLLPLVATSNEMPRRIDPRLHSRLFDRGRALVFEILAGDYRMKAPEAR